MNPQTSERSVIWAKLSGYRYWPGIMISAEDCGKKEAENGQTWVFWFGDHLISMIPFEKLMEFTSYFKTAFVKSAGRTYQRAVIEAIGEIAFGNEKELHFRDKNDSKELLAWANLGFPAFVKSSDISENTRGFLRCIKEKNTLLEQMLEQMLEKNLRAKAEKCLIKKTSSGDNPIEMAKWVMISINDICIGCNCSSKPIFGSHPLFVGSLCEQCYKAVMHAIRDFPENILSELCIICGKDNGESFICNGMNCKRSFCVACVVNMCSPNAYKEIMETDPWMCFLCAEVRNPYYGLIVLRPAPVVIFSNKKISHVLESFEKKKKIRVLSFNDNGLQVLKKLQIKVDSYFICDAYNEDSFKNGSVYLGNFEDIESDTIIKKIPIDLFIGCTLKAHAGQPNKALESYTLQFLEFFRIMMHINQCQGEKKLFWIFISESNRIEHQKKFVNCFLECESYSVKTFSDKQYYVWSNIPMNRVSKKKRPLSCTNNQPL